MSNNLAEKSNTFFECEHNKLQVTEDDVEFLSNLVNSTISAPQHKHSDFDLKGVSDYLQNHDYKSKSEGRDANVEKKSFSPTEILNAVRYKDDEAKIAYLVYRYKFNHYPRNKIVNNFPIVVCIEPTSICNLRCIMCFQADKSFSSDKKYLGMMDFEFYKRVIDECAENELRSIVLASRGEPFLHPRFCEMVEYAKTKGIMDIKINTNATKLNEEQARRLLRAEPNLLVFSVDSSNKEEYERIRVGAKFDEVVTNIRNLNRIRKEEFPNSTVRTRISMVIIGTDQDVEAARIFWKDLVDEFAVNKVTNRLDIYNLPKVENNNHCSLLWERLYIWWDGLTNPCDEDYKSILSPGKVDANITIKQIWNGEKMKKFRELHENKMKNSMHPCSRCPGF